MPRSAYTRVSVSPRVTEDQLWAAAEPSLKQADAFLQALNIRMKLGTEVETYCVDVLDYEGVPGIESREAVLARCQHILTARPDIALRLQTLAIPGKPRLDWEVAQLKQATPGVSDAALAQFVAGRVGEIPEERRARALLVALNATLEAQAQGLEVFSIRVETGVAQYNDRNVGYQIELSTAPAGVEDASRNLGRIRDILRDEAAKLHMETDFRDKPPYPKVPNAQGEPDEVSGNGCHVHFCLYDENGRNLLLTQEGKPNRLFESILAQTLRYCAEGGVFLASPSHNAQKRYGGRSAPKSLSAGIDMVEDVLSDEGIGDRLMQAFLSVRQHALRVVGYHEEGPCSEHFRFELRIPGGDIGRSAIVVPVMSVLQGVLASAGIDPSQLARFNVQNGHHNVLGRVQKEVVASALSEWLETPARELSTQEYPIPQSWETARTAFFGNPFNKAFLPGLCSMLDGHGGGVFSR